MKNIIMRWNETIDRWMQQYKWDELSPEQKQKVSAAGLDRLSYEQERALRERLGRDLQTFPTVGERVEKELLREYRRRHASRPVGRRRILLWQAAAVWLLTVGIAACVWLQAPKIELREKVVVEQLRDTVFVEVPVRVEVPVYLDRPQQVGEMPPQEEQAVAPPVAIRDSFPSSRSQSSSTAGQVVSVSSRPDWERFFSTTIAQ